MARIPRFTSIIFASGAAGTDIEQFGSKQQTGIPNYTTHVNEIQSLAAWTDGWSAAIVTANKAPYKQDVNAVDFAFSTLISYLFQQGIPEWDAATEYYASPNPSIVQYNGGSLYQSLQDANTGNVPPAAASNAFWKFIFLPPTQPTRTVLASGAGTYNIPVNPSPMQLRIRMVGGGGGGGAQVTNSGVAGSNTVFGTAFLTVNGGGAGGPGGTPGSGSGGTGGAGGAATGGSVNIAGGSGNGGGGGNFEFVAAAGGGGGNSPFGGAGGGTPGGVPPGTGPAAATNSGSGGGGAANGIGGAGGGGAGGYLEAIVNSPASSYSYTVGAGGAGGTAGGAAGGAGGSGIIVIDEYYY